MFYITIPTKYGKSYWTGHAFGAKSLAKTFRDQMTAQKEISLIYQVIDSLSRMALEGRDVEYKIYWTNPQIETIKN